MKHRQIPAIIRSHLFGGTRQKHLPKPRQSPLPDVGLMLGPLFEVKLLYYSSTAIANVVTFGNLGITGLQLYNGGYIILYISTRLQVLLVYS